MADLTIDDFNSAQDHADRAICEKLRAEIEHGLSEAESKIWHAHPVWFLDGNPIVGYSKLKHCVRLMFWSGQSFETPGLSDEGAFKAAVRRFTNVDQIDPVELQKWLSESRKIQWDYKNIYKRKGQLVRLR
ncbi:MAG: DUF1801 domain-containing protein [Boseongicola sp.]|nr:DUF1801 domain-containing protein [Boseongicola sp.]